MFYYTSLRVKKMRVWNFDYGIFITKVNYVNLVVSACIIWSVYAVYKNVVSFVVFSDIFVFV